MRKAFTLAETLITLAIIGVVAAISIPSLMNKTQDQELKSAWKKQYSTLANAFNLILNENGGNIKGLCSDDACLLNLFKDKLIVQKSCPTNSLANCYIPYNKVQNSAGGSSDMFRNSGMILSDGSYLAFIVRDSDCNYSYNSGLKNCGNISIDVNGKKPPNIQGKDIFRVFIDENKIWPAGIQDDEVYLDGANHGCGAASPDANFAGLGCSAKYLYE